MQARFFRGNDADFLFWTPTAEDAVLVGPEQRPVPLSELPLPVYSCAVKDDMRPDDNTLGAGIFEYLRRYPDCAEGYYLADLLRNAFPHYLADIASQVIMIEEKEVDAPFVRRKITGLKILSLLEAQPQLYYQLGRSYFELATMFAELPHCRHHLLAGREYLRRSLSLDGANPAALNLLAQIEAWFGLYDEAASLWRQSASLVVEPTRSALLQRAEDFLLSEAQTPLIDDLEAFGETLIQTGAGDFSSALTTLERLNTEGRVMAELPTPEFNYLLGHCRQECSDPHGALVAYLAALAIDPDFLPARTAIESLRQGRAAHV